MKLSQKITIIVSILTSTIILSLGIMFLNFWTGTMVKQLEFQARDLALTVSHTTFIKEVLGELAWEKERSSKSPYEKQLKGDASQSIQNFIQRLRLKTRPQYIYVMDLECTLYSHPVDLMIGYKHSYPLAKSVLKNRKHEIKRSKISIFKNSSTIEAGTPVYHKGKLVGVVIVGISTGKIYQETKDNLARIVIFLAIAFIVGIITAKLLSNNIKKVLFGLEPKEIAFLLTEKEMVLEHLTEGIVAVNAFMQIMIINNAAKKLLKISSDDLTRNISDYYFKDGFLEVLFQGKQIPSLELQTPEGLILLASFHPVYSTSNEFLGVIGSFENLTEVRRKAEELTLMTQLTDSLRAQSHEFMNKLHTISGLIQLNQTDQALEYISATAETRKDVINTLTKKIKNSSIAGLLLVKYNKAMEDKIYVEIDEFSELQEIPVSPFTDDLCSIIGNLFDNATDELRGRDSGEIFCGIYESGGVIRIILGDNGRGIPENMKDAVFEKGVSSKGESRGFGLFIIKQLIDKLEGSVSVKNENGTVFDIKIPYERTGV